MNDDTDVTPCAVCGQKATLRIAFEGVAVDRTTGTVMDRTGDQLVVCASHSSILRIVQACIHRAAATLAHPSATTQRPDGIVLRALRLISRRLHRGGHV